MAAPPIATSSTIPDTKKCTSDEDDSTATALSSPFTIASYSCMWRSMPSRRASRPSTFVSTSLQDLLHVAPARHHPAQQLVPLGARLAIGIHRFLVRLHHGLVDVGEHFVAAVLRLELRDGFDGLHPARRIRRHVHRALMIPLDLRDRLAQRAMQMRIVREILADGLADAHELALDDALLRFAAGGEQHFAIALRQPRLTPATRSERRCAGRARSRRWLRANAPDARCVARDREPRPAGRSRRSPRWPAMGVMASKRFIGMSDNSAVVLAGWACSRWRARCGRASRGVKPIPRYVWPDLSNYEAVPCDRCRENQCR